MPTSSLLHECTTCKHKTQKTNNILFQAPYGYCVHNKHYVASTTGLRQDFGNFVTLGLLLGHTPLSRDHLCPNNNPSTTMTKEQFVR